MPLPVQKYREIVFQILYSQSFESGEESDMISFMMNELKVTRKVMQEAHSRMHQVVEKQEEIDQHIRDVSTEYTLERIPAVERTILRLGLFELLFDSQTPPKVAIAEAIRLCRKFATPESSQFVNAILDGVYKKHGALHPEESVSL